MSKLFTPEEIAKSLEVCFGTCCGCGGCIYEVEPDLSSSEVDCRTDLVNIAAGTIKAQAKRIGELEELVEDRTKDVLFYAEREKWIPVEERLPATDDGPIIVMEDCTAVLVLVMIEGTITATTLYCDVDDGYFFDIQVDELIPYRVTRWKPMPKGLEVEVR